MTDKKVVFVAFAIEDERMRDLFKGQSLHPRHPYEFIDMSVKKPYDTEWKEKVRTRIRRSDGIVALVSKNSLTSSGQKWEIQCAKEEGKKIRGIWIYSMTGLRWRASKPSNGPTLTWRISSTRSELCVRHSSWGSTTTSR